MENGKIVIWRLDTQDVDYLVISDAAALMASGDSPYKRMAYRYSPLLAFVLIPNTIIHRSLGKFLFQLLLRRVPDNICTYSVMVWLLDPITLTIGTRGNCEPIVCAMIRWIIICVMNGNVLQAAFWYGLVVHFRIYPIYALPVILVLDPQLVPFWSEAGRWQLDLLVKESQPTAVRM